MSQYGGSSGLSSSEIRRNSSERLSAKWASKRSLFLVSERSERPRQRYMLCTPRKHITSARHTHTQGFLVRKIQKCKTERNAADQIRDRGRGGVVAMVANGGFPLQTKMYCNVDSTCGVACVRLNGLKIFLYFAASCRLGAGRHRCDPAGMRKCKSAQSEPLRSAVPYGATF